MSDDEYLIKKLLAALKPTRKIHYLDISALSIDEDFYLPKRAVEDPIPFDDQLNALCDAHDSYFWPHKNACPLCGHDAYVGFNVVECCMSSCKNFVHKPGYNR